MSLSNGPKGQACAGCPLSHDNVSRDKHIVGKVTRPRDTMDCVQCKRKGRETPIGTASHSSVLSVDCIEIIKIVGTTNHFICSTLIFICST